MDKKMSRLKFFSVGIAAENKPLGSNELEITPVEELPFTDGEITDNVTEVEAQGEDSDGKAYDVEVKSTSTIKATWLPICNGNRVTSPDVRRGATLMLYQMADEKKYYWTTLKNDLDLRKLETVIYSFSGTQTENSEFGANNSYFIEISTHKGLVHLHTSKANKEPFEYDISLNTKDGIFTLTDDTSNSFMIDSQNKTVRMESSLGSFIEILGKDININCEGNFNVNVVGSSSETIGQTSTESVGSTKTISSNGNTLEAPSNTLNAPSNQINGNLGVAPGGGAPGDGTIAGSFTFSDSIDVMGTVTARSGMNVGGDLKAKKVTSEEPISAPNV